MKRKAIALTLILALLFSALAGLVLFDSAEADPYIPGYFPLEPVVTPPTITVKSPVQNQSYSSSDVWLNFTITKPKAWFVNEVAYTENLDPETLTIGRVTSVYFILDDGEPQNITVNDGGLPSEFSIDVSPTRILNFSTRLLLTGRVHFVKVGFEANTYYYTGWDVNNPGLRSVAVNGTSEEIIFTVVESFPTILAVGASGASLAIVCVGLIVYFKKRNH
jgi:hypothetical protein